jgi:hypothetical protein
LKGKRKGYELDWDSLVSGDAALAAGLNAMLAAVPRAAGSERTYEEIESSGPLVTAAGHSGVAS